MFTVIPLLSDASYMIILAICCCFFFVGFLIAKFLIKNQKKTSEQVFKPEHKPGYEMSNFGIPGEIKAVKTYDRSGVYVNAVDTKQEEHDVLTCDIQESAKKDDLKKIEGIGPQVEEQLNNFGVYTFEQLTKIEKENTDNQKILISLLPQSFNLEEVCHQAKLITKKRELSA